VTRTIPQLVREARSAARRAYAPYSEFRVGAVLEDASGSLYHGANIENASYPLGFCAERVALLHWRSEGRDLIRRAVVFVDTPEPIPPCGLCRDALRRFAPEAEVYLATRREWVGPVQLFAVPV